jgi:hypothetical protein
MDNETALALHVPPREWDQTPLRSAVRTGSFCAVAALAQFDLTPMLELFYHARTEATAEALLDALTGTSEATES